jgi:hypothetical protein
MHAAKALGFICIYIHQVKAMIRIASFLLILPALAVALWIANDDWGLSLVETLIAIFVIVGFAVTAAGWTIRHDI